MFNAARTSHSDVPFGMFQPDARIDPTARFAGAGADSGVIPRVFAFV
jgi:hypothetical protein